MTDEYPPFIYGGMGTSVGGLVTASILCGMTVRVLVIGNEQAIPVEHPPTSDLEYGVEDSTKLKVVYVSVRCS